MEEIIKEKKGIIILIIGIIFTLIIMYYYPAEVQGNALLILAGTAISTVGFYLMIKDKKETIKWPLTIGFLAVLIILVSCIDFIDTLNHNHIPRFIISKTTYDKMIVYKTPLYDVYRINPNTIDEYYLVDQKQEYSPETLQISDFNRRKSGIDKIINYKDKYVGNSTNDGNLITHLPLSEYGYTFEIKTQELGLIIRYNITEENIPEEIYIKKALIYNYVSIFALIDNVQFVDTELAGRTYHIERKDIQEQYPYFSEIVISNTVNNVTNYSINKDNFNKYVEEKVKDEEFVNETFDKLFK